MTKEEAIKWLKDIHHRFNPTGEVLENEGGDVHLQALDMAIEALQAKTDGDIISRQDAMEAVRKVWCNNDDRNDFKQKYYEMGNNDAVEDALGEIEKLPTVVASTEFLISRYDAKDKAKEIMYSILDDTDYNNIESMTHACLMMKIKILKMFDALPSAEAEQVTGKLNKRDDSLLTDDTETCKEQKSKLDLISREEVLKMIIVAGECEPDLGYTHLHDVIKSLPSAEPREYGVLCALADRACPFQGKEYAWCLTCPHISEEDRALVKKVASEQKTGTWKQISPARIYECSECGRMVMTGDIGTYKFCHGCGSRMNGGEEE